MRDLTIPNVRPEKEDTSNGRWMMTSHGELATNSHSWLMALRAILAARRICAPVKYTLVPMLEAKTDHDHGNVTRAFSWKKIISYVTSMLHTRAIIT